MNPYIYEFAFFAAILYLKFFKHPLPAMSVSSTIARYLLIVKKLKQQKYSTKDEISVFLQDQLPFLKNRDQNISMATSSRTLDRDIEDLRRIFGLDIEYCRRNKGYHITNHLKNEMDFQLMMESMDIFNTLSLSAGYQLVVHLEPRPPRGTSNMPVFVNAIKNYQRVRFNYLKFWDGNTSLREAEPYGIKEYRSRFYLIAKDLRDGMIKTFALDRVTDADVTGGTFRQPKDYNLTEAFFAMPTALLPRQIKSRSAWCFPSQHIRAITLKSLPLHASQAILEDNDTELTVSLHLVITHDLHMDLLSYGSEVEVLEPESLRREIQEAHQEAAAMYAVA